ncbi:MAG TPA: class A beta-lactamase [Steroidobacteraceae bacterium]|nr:class A beta-lactamase [Steroidobacteraceae bacterium]
MSVNRAIWTRRNALSAMLALPVAAYAAAPSQSPFRALEQRHGGRLGVAALDVGSGRMLSYRADERFPMCSTFKLIAVAAVLAHIDHGQEKLDRPIAYGPSDLLETAPVTRAHVQEGSLTVEELCAAAIEYSDNTAANLLLRELGGPQGATRFTRSIGDQSTRIDRMEPLANTCVPGDPRDTTTPSAMLADLQSLTLRNVLSEAARSRLTAWLANCKTRFPRIPAGLPAGWRSGNKMGTGSYGTTNDVAILWPPRRAPILVAAYYTGSSAPSTARDAVLAEVGRRVAAL